MARYVSNRAAFLKAVDRATAAVAYEGARFARTQMRRGAKYDSQMQAAIKVKKSRFKNGGYTAGVFDKAARWEDSLSARAIYQSYGWAKPYQGRRYVGRKNVIKNKKGNKFIRLSLLATRRALPRMIKGALK